MRKIDLLTQIHKEQRERLYSLSIKAGSIDFNDKNTSDSFNSEFNKLINDLSEHSENEELLILPLLKERFPKAASLFTEDHRKNEEMLHILIKKLGELNHAAAEEKLNLSLDFYRAFNKFIGEYLIHIHEEEEIILPILAKDYSYESQLGVMISFMCFRHHKDPEKIKNFISSMIDSLNLGEIKILFKSMKAHTPAVIFQRVCEFSKKVLDPEIWLEIEKEEIS